MSLNFEILRALDAIDQLHHVALYLAGQFRRDMTRSEAIANFQARAVVSRAQAEVLWLANKMVGLN